MKFISLQCNDNDVNLLLNEKEIFILLLWCELMLLCRVCNNFIIERTTFQCKFVLLSQHV
jgi:hypothetical protein